MGSTEQQASHRFKRSLNYSEAHMGHSHLLMNHNEPIKDDNGLVNHMNFGVLDWGHLENWKSNEKRIPPRFINTSLVGSGSVRFLRNKNKTQQTPNCSKGLPPRVRWPRGVPVEPQISESYEYHMVEQLDNFTTENETSLSADVDDHLTEVVESRVTNCFSPRKLYSLNPFSDVPLSADVECPNVTPVTPLRGGSLNEHSTGSKKHDLDGYEHPALKCKQPSSPNRKFSLSIGKMARSFSLKESPTVPVNSQESVDLVNHNLKKPNATNPSRSSPLRRFLDPLLKPKGAHLAEKVYKSKLDLSGPSPSIFPLNENDSLQSKKHKSSNVQALLQLTLKNGIPFFKLAVEGCSDLLTAAVRKLPSGKEDTGLTYAFYSVHETKKKSGGWIYQSSEKSYCFEYNIVGQMKISSSYHAEFSGPDKGLYVVRESVLYSTEATCADQKTLDCMPEGELAAIIVKNSSDESCGDIGSFKTTVVLSDRVHSWPNSLSRSPLINRWRSGGSCDCGGWDVGCQFHVLKTSTNSSTLDHLDLCYQVGSKNKCSFRLVSVEDGLYSLEYGPSMSLLQAFSICVAIVSSQKLTHIFEVKYVPESYTHLKSPASHVARV